jgi:phosphate-selective porin OprO and OprP
VLTKTHLKTLCGSVILGCLAALSTPAIAANEAMLDLIDIMERKGTLTKEEAELLKAAAKADVEKTEAVAHEAKEVAKKEVEKVTKDLPKIETAGKLKVTSGDGDFSWGLIGRIHADYNLVNSDENKIGNDAFIRRARLGMEGTMWKHWIWKLEMDFAEDALSTKDAFIGYKDNTAGGAGWWVKAGQSHIPFGLATISSSKYMLFIERPLLADGPLQPSRQLGVAAFMNDAGGRWTFHTGIFGGAVGSGGAGISDEFNVAARGTFVPFMQDKTHLASIGAGVWYRNAWIKQPVFASVPVFSAVATVPS